MRKFVPVVASVFVFNMAVVEVSAGLGLSELATYRCRTAGLGQLGPIEPLKNAIASSQEAARNAATPKKKKDAEAALKQTENRLKAASEEEAVLIDCLLGGKMQKNLFALVRRLINGDTKGATKEAAGFTPWYNTLPEDLRSAIRATANAWTNAGDKATKELKAEQANLQKIWDNYRRTVLKGGTPGGAYGALSSDSLAQGGGVVHEEKEHTPLSGQDISNLVVRQASRIVEGLLGSAADRIIGSEASKMEAVEHAVEVAVGKVLPATGEKHTEAVVDRAAEAGIEVAAEGVSNALVASLIDNGIVEALHAAEEAKKEDEQALKSATSNEEKAARASKLRQAAKAIASLKKLEVAARLAKEARVRAEKAAAHGGTSAEKANIQVQAAEKKEVEAKENVVRTIEASLKEELSLALKHGELSLALRDPLSQEERERRFKRKEAKRKGYDETDYAGLGLLDQEEKKAKANEDNAEAIPLYPASVWSSLQNEYKGKVIGIVERLTPQGGLIKIIGGDVVGSYAWFRGAHKALAVGVLVELKGKLEDVPQLPEEYRDAAFVVTDHGDAAHRKYGPRLLEGKPVFVLPKEIASQAKGAKYVGRVVIPAQGSDPAVAAVYTQGQLLGQYVLLETPLTAEAGDIVTFDAFIPRKKMKTIHSMRAATLANRYDVAGVVTKVDHLAHSTAGGLGEVFPNPNYRPGAEKPTLGDRAGVRAEMHDALSHSGNKIGTRDGINTTARAEAAAARRAQMAEAEENAANNARSRQEDAESRREGFAQKRKEAAEKRATRAQEVADRRMKQRALVATGATEMAVVEPTSRAEREEVLKALPQEHQYPVVLRAVSNDTSGVVFDVLKGGHAGSWALMHPDTMGKATFEVGKLYTVKANALRKFHEFDVQADGKIYKTTALVSSQPTLIVHAEQADKVAADHATKEQLTAVGADRVTYVARDKKGNAVDLKTSTMVHVTVQPGGLKVDEVGPKDVYTVSLKEEGEKDAVLTVGSTTISTANLAQSVRNVLETGQHYIVRLDNITRVERPRRKGGKVWALKKEVSVKLEPKGGKPGILG